MAPDNDMVDGMVIGVGNEPVRDITRFPDGRDMLFMFFCEVACSFQEFLGSFPALSFNLLDVRHDCSLHTGIADDITEVDDVYDRELGIDEYRSRGSDRSIRGLGSIVGDQNRLTHVFPY